MKCRACCLVLAISFVWGGTPTPSTAETSPSAPSRPAQFTALDLRKADAKALVRWLGDAYGPTRSAAVREIGRRKLVTANQSVRSLLTDPLLAVRVDAAEVLLGFGDESGLPTLKSILADKSATPATALRAAGLLAKENDESGKVLALSQLSSPYFTNRSRALDVLKESKDADVAYSAMSIGLADSSSFVRMAAIRHLGEMATMRSLALLQQALTSTERVERSYAFEAIGRTRLWAGVPMLIGALGDAELGVRYVAASELRGLTGQTYDPRVLDKPESVRQLQKQWSEWWDANKAKHSDGEKSTLPAPRKR